MEIAFESKSLRRICENSTVAESELGCAAARTLRRRLSDIQATSSLLEIEWGNRRTEGEGLEQRMLFDLGDENFMVISANHVRNPLASDGNPEWSKISRVKLICIERNHE